MPGETEVSVFEPALRSAVAVAVARPSALAEPLARSAWKGPPSLLP